VDALLARDNVMTGNRDTPVSSGDSKSTVWYGIEKLENR
jgi:hypothetical protein